MAGSADITGRQNYVLGIGHPKTKSLTESAPAVFNSDATALVGPDGTLYYFANQPYTWATKPAAAGNTGLTIRVTDVGVNAAGSHWFSDGTYWRPVGGSVLLAMGSGSIASPIQSLTGNTGATFTAAQPTIPAGLLVPGAQIELWAHCRRVGANGTANFNAAIGTSGTASDANIFGFSMAATNNLDVCPSPMVDVHSTTGINTTNWLQVAGTSGGSAAADVSANFNVASAMKVSLYTSSANALDAFNLIKYRLRVHF